MRDDAEEWWSFDSLLDLEICRKAYIDDLAQFVEANNLGALHPGEQEWPCVARRSA